MWIKPTIVVLLVLLLISLFSSFVFLMKDQGRSKRTLYGLGIRVSLAAALVAVIAWGAYTGQLRSHAPWTAAMAAKQNAAQPAPEP
jgi:purine-cytosine permease-like protein